MENRELGGIGFTAGHWPLDPEKPTLIFIHGAASNNAFWNPQVEYFSEIVNTIAMDLPGHGTSRGPGKEKVADYADSVLDFIDLIQAPRPVPCGLSMGGAIAQHLLISHNDRFPAGILINTGARLKVIPLIFETIEKNYGDFVQMLFAFAISGKSSAEKLRSEIEACSVCRPAVASGDFRACDGFNVMDALGRIAVPVLVLNATDDNLTPLKYGSFLANSIKDAELVTIQDAGHFSPIEKPLEVNRAIHDFFTRTLR
ncbi:MAG: alpha/beta fold hydrolase [Deltaproteobacteria bacterium]|nr:alpha/beta fold hydrolase [Deltaproteobacteria bacterium]